MKTMTAPVQPRPSSRHSAPAVLAAFLATMLALPANAAIEIPGVPPMSGNGVPPNILFILDDSGSMVFETMPTNLYQSWQWRWQDQSYVHNSVYYNPLRKDGDDNLVEYQTWSTPTGGRMAGGDSYTAVYADLSRVGGDTINLYSDDSCDRVDRNGSNTWVCGGTQVFYVPKEDPETQSAAYLRDRDNFYRYAILGSDWGSAAGQIWQCEWDGGDEEWDDECVRATPTDGRDEAAERRNYAIWFSYHRTRMKAAKAGATAAFSSLDGDRLRVGFTTIWGPNGSGADNEEFLIPVGDDNGLFRDDNRDKWFEVLRDARGYNGTPLRRALQRAGEYFSDDDSDGPYGGNLDQDGKQFQCRQNFSILTTDGYWNGSRPDDVGNADNQDGDRIYGPDDPDDDKPAPEYEYDAAMPYAGSDSNTLADVAMHYWKNDLRDDMANIVPSSTANPAFWQHMVTFGISIGLKGTLDQSSVKEVLEEGIEINGAALTDWPDPTDEENEERIDDLLHAAVNGHGEFVAATSPDEFAAALKDSLSAILGSLGSSSNVSSNSTTLSLNTRLFAASYYSGRWSGDLKALKVENMLPVNEPPQWVAAEKMPMDIDGRDIFVHDGTGKEFEYAELSASLKAKLATPLVSVGVDADFANAAELAEARVEYIRGSNEFELSNAGPFRNRYRPLDDDRAPLGDIIHSSPFYLESEAAGGTGAVFVGANDGMLHAFNADSGEELFAYMPAGTNWTDLVSYTAVDYPHAYFVDGPITVAPRALTGGRNILVGALGRGGKGLYALDVTDPTGFSESDIEWDNSGPGNTDADMGHVISRMFVAPLNNGRPGVIFGNGLNSTNGHAVLYVVDLLTGEVLSKIDTGVAGDNALSAPTGWDSDGNGTVDAVYAGDLKGNLWQFDLSSGSAGDWDVAFSQGSNPEPMFVATDGAGNRQAISGAVSIALDPVTYTNWIVFGTGRLYNDDDLWNADGSPNHSINSIYGIRIPDAPLGTRADIDNDDDGLQVRYIELAGLSEDDQKIRGFELAGELDPGKQGWVLDLLTPPKPGTAEGERVIGDAQVINGVFVFSSIIPSTDPCQPGGSGFLNAINAFTGASVPEYFFDLDGDGAHTDNDDIGGGTGGNDGDGQRPVGSVDAGVGLPTNPNVMDKVACVNGSAGTTACTPINNPATSGRISWRELIGD